jgi:RNA polymerase sigma-70 factor (ECF subfamily)
MQRGDAEIVAAVLAGDREAFRLLVERYQRPMLASARHVLGDSDLAQDAAQEAFIEAFRALGNLKEPQKFRAWLYGILRHRCLKIRDAAGPATLPYDESYDTPVEDVYALAGEDGSLVALLRRLPREDRELLTARYVQQLSYAEIAGALQMNSGAVRVRCFRARERLREIIAREEARQREDYPCDYAPAAGTRESAPTLMGKAPGGSAGSAAATRIAAPRAAHG